MEYCSTSLGYVHPSVADVSDDNSDMFVFVKFGGQSTETATTSNRLEIITGPINFDGEVKCTSYRDKKREYREFQLPEEFSHVEDNVQLGDVPRSRMGASLAPLDQSKTSLIMIGGLSIPKPDKQKFHPTDSNIFILNLSEKKWIKLDQMEELNRAEHFMHMFEGKCFIIGGYSFRNNLASEIFHFNQVIELQIEMGTHSKPTCSINRMITLDVTGPHTINFCSVGASNHVLLFGGYSYPQYDPLKQDMYKFCPPKTNSNKRPKRESMLYDIDLSTLEVKCDIASREFATADGTLQILSNSENNQIENLLIVGGSGERIDLYSTFNFEISRCEIPSEYGGCIVSLTTVSGEKIECKICKKNVHRKCDTYTRGVTTMLEDKYKCPECNNYDPSTKKKRK